MPKYWEDVDTLKAGGQHILIKDLKTESKEFKDVEAEFKKTLPNT